MGLLVVVCFAIVGEEVVDDGRASAAGARRRGRDHERRRIVKDGRFLGGI
jgi:hypothetical protein